MHICNRQGETPMNWNDLKFFLEVARAECLADAARKLSVNASTVSRRIHSLEKDLSTALFQRSPDGHVLTEHGQKLLKTALNIEKLSISAEEEIQGQDQAIDGHIRIAATDAFGSVFLAPEIARYCNANDNISVELLTLQRNANWTRHEVDFSITVEKPFHTSLIVSKLCDYRLKLYATKEFLQNNPLITDVTHIDNHHLFGYVDDLIFSSQLSYLGKLAPNSNPFFKSTSVITQYMAVREGLGIAVLPCFLARLDDSLVPILDDSVNIKRSFWVAALPEHKHLTRVENLWSHLKSYCEERSSVLMGDA